MAGHTLVAVPYVLRTTLAVLQNFDRRVEEAAAMLGAAPARVFFEVTLPLIRSGGIAGGIFGFIVSFDQLPEGALLRPSAITRSFCPCRAGVGGPLSVAPLFRSHGCCASGGAASDGPIF